MNNRNESTEAFEALKAYLIKNENAIIASGGREVVKRCHFCGDSRDLSSRHLYIGLKDDGSIKYNCFKCQSHGTVDGEFLRNIGCYDGDLIRKIIESSSKCTSRQYIDKTRIHKIANPILTYRDAPETYKKLESINKRLGVSLSLNDITNLRIVLNLYDYLNANHIGITRAKDVADQLDMFFLGFLSVGFDMIIMRRLVPEGKLYSGIDTRYVNYNIYNSRSVNKFYFIPTKVDTLYPIEVHIAEGPFDILGVYLNTNANKVNSIFASAGGKDYASLINFIIMSSQIMNFDLHIYADNDNSDNILIKNIQRVRPFCRSVIIHRNVYEGQKDYGVSRDLIIDRAYNPNSINY
jgi:hypothetical protein